MTASPVVIPNPRVRPGVRPVPSPFFQPKVPHPKGQADLELTDAQHAALQELASTYVHIRNVPEAICRVLGLFCWVLKTRLQHGEEVVWRYVWGRKPENARQQLLDPNLFAFRPEGITCTEVPPPPDMILSLTFTPESFAEVREAMGAVGTDDISQLFSLALPFYRFADQSVKDCGQDAYLTFSRVTMVPYRRGNGRVIPQRTATVPVWFRIQDLLTSYR